MKRVEIAKPDGGIRKIGIPTIRDRVVQHAVKNIPEPIFDPDFHPYSYGYRPGRGAHDAIAKATAFMRDYDLTWVVDMDLSKCFDMDELGLFAMNAVKTGVLPPINRG